MSGGGGFVLISVLAVHSDRPDSFFRNLLHLIRDGAVDGRKYVRKAIDWALRSIGKRNKKLNRTACDVAEEMAKSEDDNVSWVGRHALKELKSEKVRSRL